MASTKSTDMLKMLLSSPFAKFLKDKIHVVKGENGKIVCEMLVNNEHTNLKGMLHGGLTSTLVDVVSSAALASSNQQQPVIGVSVDMNITFLSAAKAGQTLLIEAETQKVGKNLAFLSVDIRNKDTGVLVAHGRHTKFIALG